MFHQRRWFSATALVLALTLVASACGADDDASTTIVEPAAATTTTATDAGGLAPGTYTFGFTAITSGAVAFAGVPHLNGLELAEREINASGFLGAGVTVEFLVEDAGGDQPAAIAINDTYIANDDVLGIVCCALSSVAGAIQPNIVAAGIPWVDHAAISPTITDPDNAFRSFPLSQPSTTAVATAAIAALAPANAVVVVTADNDGLLSDRDANLGALEAGNVEVLAVVDTFADDTDMSGAATQVIALGPEVVFLAMLGNTEVLMIQELRDRGYAGPIVGNLAIATSETFNQAGDTLVGTILPLAFFAGNSSQMVQDFSALYEAEYDTMPDIFAAQGWQVAWFMATALKNGGEGSREAVLQGIRDIDSMETVFGNLTWDDRGEATIEEWTFVQWSADGELVLWDGTAAGILPNVNKTATDAVGLASGTYTFGFTAITSGAVAFAGVPHLNGLELAEREINASGFLGAGVTVEFLVEDAGGDQPAAIAINDTYIANDDVLGIVCCALSSVAGAIQPNIVAAGIPWVDHAAISPTITDPDNAFRSFPLSQPSTTAVATAAIAALAPANAVVVVTADNDGLLSDRDANLGALEAGNVEVLAVVDTFADDTDMSGAATQVIALGPEVVFLAMLGNTEVLMIQELRDRGYAGPIVGNLAIATSETFNQAGDTLVGTILPLAFFAGNSSQMVQDFSALYEAEYDTMPDIFAAQGWQVAWFMATALKNGGEGSREAVLQGIRDIDSMETVFGNLTWDDRGEATIEEWTFVQWSADGELVLWDGTAAGILPNVNK